MDRDERKKRADAYRERVCTGGVYVIRNLKNGKMYLDCTADIAAMQNRFAFLKQTNACVLFKLKKDWDAYGPDAFALEVLETLDKGDNQTDESFMDDLMTLKDIKLAETDPALLY
jgi:hypothetical protein